MPAVAKNEPFVGFTLKAIIVTMILESATLLAIQKACEKNFPRKFGKPAQNKKLSKIVARYLRALHRGKLKFDKIETIHCPPPKELIKIKDVEFNPPKSYLPKKEKPVKAKAEKPAAKKTTKVKSKKAPKKSSSDDEIEEVA